MAKFLDAADEMRDDVEVMEDADVTSCGGDRFAVFQAGFDLQLAYLNVDLAKGAAEDKGYKNVAESGNTVLSCLQVTDVEFDLP